MKYTLIVTAVALLSGCNSYSNRGTNEGGREVTHKGFTVRCDAYPPNQPDCYTPPPGWSWWGQDHIKFSMQAR